MSLDVAEIQADFPILEAPGARQAPRVPRLARRRRRSRIAVLDAMDHLLPRVVRQRAPRRVHDRRGERPRAYEAARAKVAALRQRARHRARSCSRTNVTEAINLVAYTWAPPEPARGRRRSCSARWSTTPTSCPWHILAAERGVELRWIPLTDDYRLDLTDLDGLLDGAKLLAVTRDVERARHASTTSARSPTPRTRPARSSSSTRARPCRTSPSTCRRGTPTSSRFTGAQDARPDRHRRAVGPARAARGDAAVPRRRRDDPRRHARTASRTNDVPWKFEAGTPPIAEAVGFGAAVDYLETLGHRRRPRARERAHRSTRSTRSRTASATSSRSTARATSRCAAARSRSSSTASTPTTSRRSLDEDGVCVRAGHHCAKPLMRVPRRPRHDPRVVLRLQRRSRRRRPRRRARSRPRSSSRSKATQDDRCPDSKTSTARSSSTTTARRGTAASCRCRPRTRPRASTRCAATRSSSTSTSTDGTVTDVKTGGQGCSISQASTSMMSAAVKGKPVDEARQLIRAFKALMSIHESKLEGEADGDGPAAPSSRACASATSRRSRAS